VSRRAYADGTIEFRVSRFRYKCRWMNKGLERHLLNLIMLNFGKRIKVGKVVSEREKIPILF
jgi:hypothetical protein